METKHCVVCESELPLNAMYFDRDNKSPDGFRKECKSCRSESRREERHEAVLSKVKQLDRAAEKLILGTLDQEGSRIPHIAELCECVMDVFGGPRGYAQFLLGEFLSHKPGSQGRTKILSNIQYMVQKTTESGAAKKPLELLSEEDLEREAEELLKRRALKIAKEPDVA